MDKQHAETMQALANQHKESMQALSALIERTGGRGGQHRSGVPTFRATLPQIALPKHPMRGR